MKTAMMIAPHADDAAAFCGATLAKLAADGWHVILVRVTDDQKDSIGYSVEGASPFVDQRAWYGSPSTATRSPRA